MDSVPGLNLLRIFRIARVFRLIPKAKGLRTMFQTLLVSLPALGNVGSVLFLFFFIFAIMGMNLFGMNPLLTLSALSYRRACSC